MSRIYDNQPLSNLPVINIDFKSQWDVDKHTKGDGVLLEGLIQSRSNFAIADSSKKKVHYYIFFIKIQKAHRRKFDPTGKEIEPNFSETKKVSTGYLQSSYKVEAKGETDRLSDDATRKLLDNPELSVLTQKYGSHDWVSLWMSADQCVGLEFQTGDTVRVKTNGNSPFVFSISSIDSSSSTISNYAGGAAVGGSWTDKIMDIKSNTPTTTDTAGVDDDEWDD